MIDRYYGHGFLQYRWQAQQRTAEWRRRWRAVGDGGRQHNHLRKHPPARDTCREQREVDEFSVQLLMILHTHQPACTHKRKTSTKVSRQQPAARRAQRAARLPPRTPAASRATTCAGTCSAASSARPCRSRARSAPSRTSRRSPEGCGRTRPRTRRTGGRAYSSR